MSDTNNTGLLREIDEELRQERYSQLWTRYGKYVIIGAIILVIGVAGYKGWEAHTFNNKIQFSEEFYRGISEYQAENVVAAEKSFMHLIDGSNVGHSMLAKFRLAASLVKQGKTAQASENYLTLAANTSIDKQYRELAKILSVLLDIDTGDPEEIRQRLLPMLSDNNPWRFSALQLSGLIETRSGDQMAAKKIFDRLISDPETPQAIKSRTQELITAITEKD